MPADAKSLPGNSLYESASSQLCPSYNEATASSPVNVTINYSFKSNSNISSSSVMESSSNRSVDVLRKKSFVKFPYAPESSTFMRTTHLVLSPDSDEMVDIDSPVACTFSKMAQPLTPQAMSTSHSLATMTVLSSSKSENNIFERNMLLPLQSFDVVSLTDLSEEFDRYQMNDLSKTQILNRMSDENVDKTKKSNRY